MRPPLFGDTIKLVDAGRTKWFALGVAERMSLELDFLAAVFSGRLAEYVTVLPPVRLAGGRRLDRWIVTVPCGQLGLGLVQFGARDNGGDAIVLVLMDLIYDADAVHPPEKSNPWIPT
ncbi:MAG: hypothetical protein KGP27_04695 [Hyphomicrobiales bacterium]|nr:hypothetical protein [Hyphomicrobiales bacterium]